MLALPQRFDRHMDSLSNALAEALICFHSLLDGGYKILIQMIFPAKRSELYPGNLSLEPVILLYSYKEGQWCQPRCSTGDRAFDASTTTPERFGRVRG